MKAYTNRQREILQFICEYQTDHGVSPTLEEIGTHFGVHRVTIFQHVNALERRGAVSRSPQLARSVQILDPDFQPSSRLQVLGTIAAGSPIEAIEHPESVDPSDVLPTDGEHYLLRVSGDSMIEDAIRPDDLVVVRRSTTARNGQVVVAIVEDNAATLKRYYRDPDGRVRLQPANARLKPTYPKEIEIRGVVTAVVRQL